MNYNIITDYYGSGSAS